MVSPVWGKLVWQQPVNWIIWGGGTRGMEPSTRGKHPDQRSEGLKRVSGSGNGQEEWRRGEAESIEANSWLEGEQEGTFQFQCGINGKRVSRTEIGSERRRPMWGEGRSGPPLVYRAFVRRKRCPLLQAQGLASGAQHPVHSVPPGGLSTMILWESPVGQCDSYSHNSSSEP